jgi:hypothetical protein
MTNTPDASAAALNRMATRYTNTDDIADVLTAIHDNDGEGMVDLGVTPADLDDAAIIFSEMTIADVQRLF